MDRDTHTPQLLAIVGPTASGKSSLADRLGATLGTSVVSVDAMQIYRHMDIGTSKMPRSIRRAPLVMIDRILPNESYSVQQFQLQARALVDELIASGKPVVFCGGGGLYLDSVIDDMHFPQGTHTSPARKKYEALSEQIGEYALWEYLEARDPQSAACIHPHNARRVVRALEMYDQGLSYAAQTSGLHVHAVKYPCLILGLDVPRDVLARRIEERVDEMLEQGLVEEVKSIYENYAPLSKTAAQAIGYKELQTYLEGRCSLDAARAQIILNTKHYAKRQRSWFRRDKRVIWLHTADFSTQEALFECALKLWQSYLTHGVEYVRAQVEAGA